MRETKSVLGEEASLSKIDRLFKEEKTFLVNLYGEEGAGKTFVLNYLGGQYENVTKVISDITDLEYIEFDQQQIYVMDDVDHFYSRDHFKDFIMKIYLHQSFPKIVFTSKNKFFLESIPGVNFYHFEMGNRRFTYQQFRELFELVMNQNAVEMSMVPDFVIKNTYLLSTYCKNFNLVNQISQHIADFIKTRRKIKPNDYISFLNKSNILSKIEKELIIDTKGMKDDDYFFSIRSKDKIEKLCDLILKYYPDEKIMVEVMKNQFQSGFVVDTFRMDMSYKDKILNICLTFDPIELLIKLLGPRDIILELAERNIGEASFTYTIEEKAKLILKNIGMNILDEPKGIEYFRNRFLTNQTLIKKEKLNKEYIIGLGISTFQELEHIFYEMINFYGAYIFESVSKMFKEYNDHNPKNPIQYRRITFGQYISIFQFLNKIKKDDLYQLKFYQLNMDTIITPSIIKMIEGISGLRSFFSHNQRVHNFEIPYDSYINRIDKLYSAVISLMDEIISKNIFPEIIKIKEVIFDEFDRRLFVAMDWKKAEIRFSLSSAYKNIDIYSQYYILREKQRVAINPILIPRNMDANQEKFEGEDYDKSSQTQFKQGNSLIEKISLKDNMKVLDIGCGNGRTTIELWKKNPSIRVDAFDLSESMVERAIQTRDDLQINAEKLQFFTLSALDLDVRDQYDLIFSNASLHWIVESQTMYQKIFHALRSGGEIAIQQGGKNCYMGLHDRVKEAIVQLDYQMYYANWTYPIYYPAKNDYEQLLHSCGFKNIHVESVETDGEEFANLEDNFANAGMLPYIHRLPDPNMKNKLKNTFLELCARNKTDKYTHRLYAFASKE
ncbi:Methyltransferase domain-containing protein [Bacillus sp. cl95]|nr:Methyltransferase domain-containing protein [Bacillus sp. UNCCL13]SFQ86830.1 Methyltransferase domain-containing protein [Bacillus sp. cl95]